ncbi:1032_t:CDS:2 [Dentiscutata erythropus]|uniref:1032_t:CDS:1 n=1 Tax=Dentiscutata erythropus TaxID=1348616 RepID=A0A9N8ZBJ5_9GLOM|nr:1032_t:CDS:2 [Dentiscutata erythropus]
MTLKIKLKFLFHLDYWNNRITTSLSIERYSSLTLKHQKAKFVEIAEALEIICITVFKYG